MDSVVHDDKGATGAIVGAGEVIEVGVGTGPGMMGNEETGSMWTTAEMQLVQTW